MGGGLTSSESVPLLILAGGGDAPRQIIDACRRAGRAFFVVCLEGHADPSLVTSDVPHAWLPLGGGGKLRDIIVKNDLRELVMIGRVRRPSIAEIKPDWWTLKVLTKIGLNALGDDGLLRAIGKVLEDECGVRVIGAHEVTGDLLTPRGCLTRVEPNPQAQADIERGVAVALALGAVDVGQAVVVQQGIVLGVEAVEGTDALLARCATLRREGVGGVLIKLAKPQQDERLDMPSFGPDTVRAARDAGLSGIAVEAGRSLFLMRDEALSLADEAGMFIVGLVPGGDA